SEVQHWQLAGPNAITLADVVRNAKPTVLIGVSGVPGAFTEDVIRAMARYTERPVIFPLSNPTSRSPYPPATANGRVVPVDQTNNSYIFPGLALGVISSHASRVSGGMIKTA